jgi:ABC-2 type transport system ATP-binding protein
MISVHSVTKRYGTFTAVEGVSFEVGRGQIVGFIGPNGAGKTTTMRMVTGFLPTSEGSIAVAGHDVFEDQMSVRRAVGYLPETPPLYAELTIGDYLQFIAEIREVPARDRTRRVGEVMAEVGLQGWERRILGSLSKGYRQRVGLAQAIIHDPRVLILDEPTSGLDPAQVVGIRDYIRLLAGTRTVVLSTHILTEVEALCSRALVIAKGKLLADDSLDGLRARAGEGLRYRIELKGPGAVQAVAALPEVQQVSPQGPADGFEQMEVRAPNDPRTAIAALATAKGFEIRAMEKVIATLEEAFLTIVGAEA